MNTETGADVPVRKTLVHLPALDGLRGLAVLGVLLFHDDRLAGGYLGVDLFFVLSGYLITSLLLKEHQSTGTIALGAFWVRRARRLFPALLALLPVVGLYAATLADSSERGRIRGDGLATLGYVANWRSIFSERSYWEMFLAPSPLEHTWSLAIEEQFYLGWPLLVAALLRRSWGTRALPWVSLVLTLLSALAMWLLYEPGHSERVYLGTDTRGAAILMGAILACVIERHGAITTSSGLRWLDAAGVGAALLLGAAWLRLAGTDAFLYRGGFWLTELAVLVLIGCAAQGRRSWVARALSLRPLGWVGMVSYGVYLWHWPVFVALDSERLGMAGLPLSALRFLVTFGISLASYWLLEQPIRKGGLRQANPWLVVPGAFVGSALCLHLGTRGATSAEPAPVIAPAPPSLASSEPGRAPRDRHSFPIGPSEPGPRLRVLVLGDSVAQALGERMFFVEDRAFAFVAERGVGDCSILEGKIPTRSLTNAPHGGGNCAAHWQADVQELRPDVTLVILGGGFFAPFEVEGNWLRVCDPLGRKAYVEELIGRLRSLAPHAGSLVLAKVPLPVGKWKKAQWDEQTTCFNAAMDEVAAAVPGVATLDLQEELCPALECAIDDAGAPIRPDGMHFGGLGAERIAGWVLSELRARSLR